MKLILPFPPPILSPNSRGHWGKKEKARTEAKQLGAIEGRKYNFIPVAGQKIGLSINFYPPHACDLDNCLARIKFSLDGLAIGMGVNDKQFRPITIDIPAIDKLDPRVEIEVLSHFRAEK